MLAAWGRVLRAVLPCPYQLGQVVLPCSGATTLFSPWTLEPWNLPLARGGKAYNGVGVQLHWQQGQICRGGPFQQVLTGQAGKGCVHILQGGLGPPVILLRSHSLGDLRGPGKGSTGQPGMQGALLVALWQEICKGAQCALVAGCVQEDGEPCG